MRTLYWTAFWVFLVDQATKYIVVHAMDLSTRLTIDLFPPFLVFRMAWNRGVNFGLFAGYDMRWALIAIALAIVVGVWVWMRRETHSRLAMLSAGVLIGGALGNVVDRLLYGAVADFINMSCCGIDNPYAFNVADVAVFVGALGLVFFTGGDAPPTRSGKSGGAKSRKKTA